MPKCEYCGKEVLFPFECNYCGKTFCAEHRLPENHQCANIPKEQFWYQKQKTIEKALKQEQPIKKGELYFIKESKEEQKPETRKPKRKFMYLIPVLCITLILVSYASYNFGYNTGYDVGYSKGYLGGNSSGYETGYNTGYIQGVTDGAGRGYNIRDPTYQEALQFVASDQTDKNQYNEENYTCANFAADFKNNAFKAGYECGYVLLYFPDDLSHALNCFNTTDHGLIFVEPQEDATVTLTIGEPYWDRTEYEPTYDDTVIKFVIVW